MLDNYTEVPLQVAAHNAADMLQELIERRGVEINIADLPHIQGNLSQLQLLFSNLISNAIKYNDSAIPKIQIRALEYDGQYDTAMVEDNGIGIPSEKIATIFTPFERLHRADQYPGSGLGLSIVKRIVQSHNG